MTTNTGSPPRTGIDALGRPDFLVLAVLLLAGVGIPLSLAAAAGTIGLPTNDDWVYMRAATTLYREATIDVPGHSAAFVGQLALVQPFLWLSRGDPWGFHAFGLGMAALGIVATYLLARRFLGMGSAAFAVLLVLVFPGFARESVSFMTDVPAYALTMLCLLLGTRWLRGEGGAATLLASIAVGVLAVSIREFMVAAPIAILVAAWAQRSGRERIWLAALSGLAAIAGVAVLRIAGSVSGHAGPSSLRPDGLLDLGPAFATLAAVLLPVTVLYLAPRVKALSPGLILLGAALACLAIVHPDGPLLGNLWTPAGLAANQVLNGSRDLVLGPAVWQFSSQLALFAGILAAVVVLTWARRRLTPVTSLSSVWAVAIRIGTSREAPLVIFLVAYAGELVLYGFVGGLFDRYLYPMVPVAAILLLRRAPQPFGSSRLHALAHGAFAWLLVSAFIITANSLAYDAGRDREGEVAVAMGYDPQIVDAGYEWVGSHGTGTQRSFDPASMKWWYDIWTSFRPCAVLANSPEDFDGYRLIRVNRSAYKQYLLFGPDQALYLYGASLQGCPAPPPAVSAK